MSTRHDWRPVAAVPGKRRCSRCGLLSAHVNIYGAVQYWRPEDSERRTKAGPCAGFMRPGACMRPFTMLDTGKSYHCARRVGHKGLCTSVSDDAIVGEDGLGRAVVYPISVFQQLRDQAERVKRRFVAVLGVQCSRCGAALGNQCVRPARSGRLFRSAIPHLERVKAFERLSPTEQIVSGHLRSHADAALLACSVSPAPLLPSPAGRGHCSGEQGEHLFSVGRAPLFSTAQTEPAASGDTPPKPKS